MLFPSVYPRRKFSVEKILYHWNNIISNPFGSVCRECVFYCLVLFPPLLYIPTMKRLHVYVPLLREGHSAANWKQFNTQWRHRATTNCGNKCAPCIWVVENPIQKVGQEFFDYSIYSFLKRGTLWVAWGSWCGDRAGIRNGNFFPLPWDTGPTSLSFHFTPREKLNILKHHSLFYSRNISNKKGC